jgi:anti-anti-sigma factor
VILADLQFSDHGRAAVARLTGEIDLSNAQNIRGAIGHAMPNHALGLVLDLSEVDFLDSAGIQLIYQLREDLRARGQILQLVIPPTSPTSDALMLGGIAHHVDIIETPDDALREPAIRQAEPEIRQALPRAGDRSDDAARSHR